MIDLVIGAPIVMALVALYRVTGMPVKFSPLASLITAIALFGAFCGFTTECLFEGIVTGLTASGLYSAGKSVVKI